MKSLLRTHYISAAASVLLLLGSLLALYFFSTTMRVKEMRVIEARDRLASFEQNKRVFTEEAKEFEVLRARIEGLEGEVLTTESVPQLLSSVEAMAAARRADFKLILVEERGEKEGAAKHLHIDFSAKGSFADLELLVKDLRSQPYQVRFSNFSLLLEAPEALPGIVSGAPKWQLTAGIDITSF